MAKQGRGRPAEVLVGEPQVIGEAAIKLISELKSRLEAAAKTGSVSTDDASTLYFALQTGLRDVLGENHADIDHICHAGKQSVFVSGVDYSGRRAEAQGPEGSQVGRAAQEA